MTDAVISSVEEVLEGLGYKVKIDSFKAIGGGSINDAYVLETDSGRFFIKTNDDKKYPGMFKLEKEGLETLKNTGAISIPKPFYAGSVDGSAFLLMSFIERGPKKKDFWQDFGRKIADLHRHTTASFGFDSDNYIGSLPQRNIKHSDWASFYAEERLQPFVRRSRDLGRCDKEMCLWFEILYSKLGEIFPEEAPSLIHGDLWSGNFLSDSKGNPVIFDPAVYYGHREMDIGMCLLFGGFSQDFYDAYNESFPLEKGWEERVPVTTLYPLLVHVLLFGASYAHQVKQLLRRLVGSMQ